MYCNLKNISFKYKEKPVLKNVSMEIHSGDIVSIVGPSGAGKTTLLKILTGLIEPYQGSVVYDPEPSLSNPRIIVFQDYQLFPHMNVYENIAFGLKARKVKKKAIDAKVNIYLDYFNLQDKSDNLPRELSAGQKQRVAIARSMILEPSLLLLDEPFANLDYNLKAETAQFIKKTQKDFNVTTVCVTHDQKEAFAMSDKIGIILEGNLVEYNDTAEVYKNSQTLAAAQFLGIVNTIKQRDYRYFSSLKQLAGDEINVRSKDIEISPNKYGLCEVVEIQYNGDYINYRVRYGTEICIISSFKHNIKKEDNVSLEIIRYL